MKWVSIQLWYYYLQETQFQQLLTDSLEFFNIPDEEIDDHFLVDSKSGLLHAPTSFVRLDK